MIKYLSQINHRGAVINLINQQGARLISIIYICCCGNEKITGTRSSTGTCSELRYTFCNIIIVINGPFLFVL